MKDNSSLSAIQTLIACTILYSFMTGLSKDEPNSVVGDKIKLFSQKAQRKNLIIGIFINLIVQLWRINVHYGSDVTSFLPNLRSHRRRHYAIILVPVT